jgi:hypothetical protein
MLAYLDTLEDSSLEDPIMKVPTSVFGPSPYSGGEEHDTIVDLRPWEAPEPDPDETLPPEG